MQRGELAIAVTNWPDEVDAVLAGDLTAAVAYPTPAGGAVVTAVAPVGLRDRSAGTLTFTTSLGFGKKLERIERDPRVSLAYHSRRLGFCDEPLYVLAQGRAVPSTEPDRDYLERVVAPAAERFMGKRKQGVFWDRWLREYYADRVPVEVRLERLVVWPDLRCEREPEVLGAPLPHDPPAQKPPAKGTAPRVSAERAAERLRRMPDVLLAYLGGDGYPLVVPVDVGGTTAEGFDLRASADLPPGGRRAGLLGHDYKRELLGIAARQHTGWLETGGGREARYAPHTERGFRAPSNKTLLLLANGLLAKRGLKRARQAAAAQA